MRTDQFVGLNKKARKWLDENAETDTFLLYKNAKLANEWTEPRCERYKEWEGAFGNSVPLHKYHLKDGSFALEVVQAEPWSSGPIAFTCLEKNGKRIRKSVWSERDMGVWL